MLIHGFCPLFNFFIFSCMNCLYVLYINPLYINPMLLLLLCHVSSVQLLSLANIYSIPYAVFLLMVSFAVQKLLGLIRFNLFIFTFTSFVIRKQIKKKKQKVTIYVKVFFLCILFGVCGFKSYIYFINLFYFIFWYMV